VLEASHRDGSLYVIRDHTELLAIRQHLQPLPQPSANGWYSIYPPIKDERLSRPEQTQVNDLPKSRYRSGNYTRCQLVKPTFCPTRHSRCEQLAHSYYVVTGFSRIRTHLSNIHNRMAYLSILDIPNLNDGHYRVLSVNLVR